MLTWIFMQTSRVLLANKSRWICNNWQPPPPPLLPPLETRAPIINSLNVEIVRPFDDAKYLTRSEFLPAEWNAFGIEKKRKEREERGGKKRGERGKGVGDGKNGGNEKIDDWSSLYRFEYFGWQRDSQFEAVFFPPLLDNTPLVDENLTPYCDFDVFASVNVRTQLKRILKRDKKKILRCFSSKFSSNEFSFNIETRERSIRES